MKTLCLRNSLPAILAASCLYAPAGHAIVKYQSVRSALEAGVPAVTVTFSDLDLDRGAGAETLYQRLRAAAKKVCGTADGRDLSATHERRRCYREALDRAVNDVNNERLEKLHGG
ncbi:MAG: UrcA family protein [Gammaproteobacteria bacterium]|nr:UrcA family protein [Gammaproteobacteria bacterium]